MQQFVNELVVVRCPVVADSVADAWDFTMATASAIVVRFPVSYVLAGRLHVYVAYAVVLALELIALCASLEGLFR